MRNCEHSEQMKEERMKEGENVLLVWSCMQYESASPSCVVSASSGAWSDGRLRHWKRWRDAPVMAKLRL